MGALTNMIELIEGMPPSAPFDAAVLILSHLP